MPPIITPVNATPKAPENQSNAQADARARAIARLMDSNGGGNQQQTAPVANPNSISPEEMGAMTTPETPVSNGQINKVEELAAEAADEATKPKEEPLSTQYAVLARKEKALRAKVQAQEAAIKAKEDALKAREDALSAKDADYQSKYIPKDRLTQDTLSVLNELGISYDQLTQQALNPPAQLDPATKALIQSLQAKVNTLEESQNKTVKTFQDSQTQAYKQALAQIKVEAQSLISNSEEFETVQATNSVQDVVDLIEQTYKEDGVLMTIEEAAKAVEDHLVEEALKIARLKKIQSRLQPPTPPKVDTKPTNNEAPQMKTLTNASGGSRPLSAKERAILAFKGELKG